MKFRITNIQNYAIAYVSLWATAPVLAYGTTYRALAVVSVLLWAALELVRKGSIFSRPTLPVVLIGVYIAYSLLVEYATDRDYTSLFQTYILLFLILVFESRKSRLDSLRPIFWLVVLTLPIWLYRTYVGIDEIDSNLARVIVRSSVSAEEFAGQGLGGYGLVYSMVLLIPMLITMVLRRHEFDFRVWKFSLGITRPILVGILALNILLGMGLIWRAGYTIAAVLMLLSVIITFVVRRQSTGHLLLVGSMSLIIFAVLLINLPTLLQQLTPLVKGTAYEPKVADMILSLDLDAARGTVESRSAKYATSIETFLDNPIIGSLSSEGIGGHSAILDRLGRYGVVFGGIFSYLYFYSLITMMRVPSRTTNMLFGMFFAAAVLAILNTVSGVFGVILFILMPAGCAMANAANCGRKISMAAV